jgi:alkylation response protein AidB-like acyl-CoA dehydrogenase
MTFDLSEDHQALRDRARALAQPLSARAADIDRTGAAGDAVGDAAALLDRDADLLTTAIVVEELAVASAAAALAVALGAGAAPLATAGLRGAPAPDTSPRAQMALLAAALGIGRAALEQALADLRAASAQPGSDEKPHWAVADVATEIDAARLLAWQAAGTRGDAQAGAIAMARLLASGAAQRAVDVALRLSGAAGYAPGAALERLARDARAVALVGGGEEAQRTAAAADLLPG